MKGRDEPSAGPPAGGEEWQFRLYIAGDTPGGLTARHTLETLGRRYLPGRYSIQVVDVLAEPGLVLEQHIIAVPTLVKCSPPPVRKVIGDLSEVELVRQALDIPPARPAGGQTGE